jgi:glutamyl-tRNA synthetase
VNGRFAPSPTGRLHLGNLRTAVTAWCSARRSGLGFVIRVEDLDRITSSAEHEANQLSDLRALGIDWEPPVIRQSDRFDQHRDALATLTARGLTFPCWCSRRDIAAAAQAPQSGDESSRYPGTCRRLTRHQKSEAAASGRQPAIRLRAVPDSGEATLTVEFNDLIAGRHRGHPDDVVLQRNDGIPAYHLAVVVDDAHQSVSQVLRGDDLLEVTPSQIHLGSLLGLPVPTYAHVPMVLGADGHRLAKRHGGVTLTERIAALGSTEAVIGELAWTLGAVSTPTEMSLVELLDRFDLAAVPRTPWTWTTSV